MKKFNILIICMITILSCKSQSYKNELKNNIMIKNSKLDVNELKQIARKPNAIEYRDLTGKVAEGIAYYFDKPLDKTDGHIAIYGDDNSGYEKLVVKSDSHFIEVYSFNETGILNHKGLMYPQGFKKGTWIYYDDNLNVVNEIDYDNPFNYKWEDVLSYLNKRKINKESIVHILRNDKSDPKIWTIEWNKSLEEAEIITINADNGKIISIKKQPISKEI